MLDRIIHFSIHNKLIIGFLTVSLIMWGGYSYRQLSIDAVPDITNNQVQIITASPSLAAQEVERLITFPLEQTMATIPRLQEVRSISRFGLSVVTIVYQDAVDVYWARQQVNERLGEARNAIPPGMGNPEMAPVSTGLGEIYQYVIHARPGYEKKYTAVELRTIQDWVVRRQLLGTPGVAEVNSFGGFLKQYEVALDPERLRSMNVSIGEVFTALQANNQNSGGAYIDKKPNAYFIRSEGLISSQADLGKIVVRNLKNGVPVLISDVGTVGIGAANRYGALTRNADGEAVGAIVMMLKGENATQVVARVKERIAQIQRNLPEGVAIEAFLDRSELVGRAMSTVSRNLIEGALIVVFVLVLFLGNFRAGLIVASVIPLAMLFAVSMMNVFSVTGNLMSLGAIDFGLIVDGAVIIVEATMHHLGVSRLARGGSGRLTQAEMDQEVYHSASNIRNSAAFGEIIILIVYLPILALVGIEGKMFRPMAQTVVFAIAGAFLLSLTYVPMMSALFLSKSTVHKRNLSDWMMDFFGRYYDPLIRGALRRKTLVLGISLALFAGSIPLFLNLGGEFIPTLEEGDFALETRLLTGSSLLETVEKVTLASKLLLEKFPEVREVVGKIGAAELPTDPMPMEASDVTVMLKDKSEWTSAESQKELAEKMAWALQAIPGVTFGISQPIQLRSNELISGVRQDVGIKIFGEDLEELTRLSEKIGRLVGSVEGAADLYLEKVTGLAQIVVSVDRDRIARHGLSVEAVNEAITTAFAGRSAGLVYEQERRFDLVVRLKGTNRQSIEDVRGLYVTDKHGEQIPLEQLARVEFRQGPNQIQREDAKRRIIVGFNVRGQDVAGVVEEIQDKIAAGITFPTGYYVTYGGQFENLQQAQQRLAIAVPVALVLIFMLLFFSFGSLRHALLIFTAIPLSAIGGVLALWLRDMPFSISAGVGFIALFGVAVLNGLVLIGEFNRRKAEGGASLYDIVRQGTAVRLRPVLMTATVASLGFLPMALSASAGAEVQKPLATVVIGGLVSATLLTLLVLPVLYLLVESYLERRANPPRTGGHRIGAVIQILLGIVASLSATTVLAQEKLLPPLTAEAAVEQALDRNGRIGAARLAVDQAGTLQKATVDPGRTSLGLTYGQYNSVNRDHHFTVNQSFSLPWVYFIQGCLARETVLTRELELSLQQRTLMRDVRAAYYTLLYQRAQQELLLIQDSLYAQFLEAAQLRFRTGEANLLEQTTARTQLLEVRNALAQAQADSRIAEGQLRALLQSRDSVRITDTRLTRLSYTPPDTAAFAQQPTLALYQQRILVRGLETRQSKAQLLPEFSVGYFNQSLIGTQTVDGVNRAYTGRDRFWGVQAGITVPLWFRPWAARIQAARLGEAMARQSLISGQSAYAAEVANTWTRVQKYESSLRYYTGSALELADQLIGQADKAYRAGEIPYVAFLQSLHQALTIRSGHLEALHQYNQAVIALQFLTGTP